MRLLSLLITLLIVGWLIYSQMGDGSKPADQSAARSAEARATAVNAQVQDQFAHQADQLSKMEAGGSSAGNP
jgi:ABC-type molybdate transport system substrate-binding protein